MAQKKEDMLSVWTQGLTRSFQRWDHIYEFGCTDPFYEDGTNLNLVRNHIIHYKKEIEELLKEEQENTFFSTPYPDIYYRATPELVDYKYMARADEIREYAKEQLALYEQDPNYHYICDHYHDVFPKGETKATRAANIFPGHFYFCLRLKEDVEQDRLVEMRREFRTSYEVNKPMLAERAQMMRAYLEAEHSPEELAPAPPEYEDDEYDDDLDTDLDEDIEVPEERNSDPEAAPKKPSLDSIIQSANARIQAPETHRESQEEQLSLF